MKLYINLLFVVILMSSFSQCSTAQKLQKELPFTLENVYFQSWVAGVQGGGSGTVVFMSLKENLSKQIQLDSIYFRGNVAKLEIDPIDTKLFIGRFPTHANQQKDIIMSNEPNAEYGNEIFKPKSKIPFELNRYECIVSYKEKDKIKYFKIQNVKEKESIQFPGVKPKN